MSETQTIPRTMLSLNELAERWGCSPGTVMKWVEDPKRPIPYIALGTPSPGSKKIRKMLRFRLIDIERWEAEQVRVAKPDEKPEPAGRPVGYTGPDYLSQRKKRGSKVQ